MFWVQFDDIEAEDVETIRQDLSRDLRLDNIPAVDWHFALLCLFPLHVTDGEFISTRVWSIIRNADGTHNFGPEPFGPDSIRGCLQYIML